MGGSMPLAPIKQVLEDLRAGRLVVLVDDERRENEGDFICAAESITNEQVTFMTRIGGGYLCVAMTGRDCDRLELSPQALVNTSTRRTPLTISVDAHERHGVGTGISAADRAATIRLLADAASQPHDFVRPGHVNPLRARAGGVLERTGHTEGSVDLCQLAGLSAAAALIEIIRPDGAMARLPDLEAICQEHDLRMCSVEQVIAHRLETEALVERLEPIEGTPIETPYGDFTLLAFRSAVDALPHLALALGGVGELDDNGVVRAIDEPVLVRMHRRDLLGDIFDATDRPSGAELRASLRAIRDAGRGVLVYLRPEVIGDGLRDRLQRIRRPDDDVNAPDLTRTDGVAARAHPIEQRDYGVGGQILLALGLRELRVLTNHPKERPGLHAFGLAVVEQVPIAAVDKGDRPAWILSADVPAGSPGAPPA